MFVAVAIANGVQFDLEQRFSLLGSRFGLGHNASRLGLCLLKQLIRFSLRLFENLFGFTSGTT